MWRIPLSCRLSTSSLRTRWKDPFWRRLIRLWSRSRLINESGSDGGTCEKPDLWQTTTLFLSEQRHWLGQRDVIDEHLTTDSSATSSAIKIITIARLRSIDTMNRGLNWWCPIRRSVAWWCPAWPSIVCWCPSWLSVLFWCPTWRSIEFGFQTRLSSSMSFHCKYIQFIYLFIFQTKWGFTNSKLYTIFKAVQKLFRNSLVRKLFRNSTILIEIVKLWLFINVFLATCTMLCDGRYCI